MGIGVNKRLEKSDASCWKYIYSRAHSTVCRCQLTSEVPFGRCRTWFVLDRIGSRRPSGSVINLHGVRGHGAIAPPLTSVLDNQPW